MSLTEFSVPLLPKGHYLKKGDEIKPAPPTSKSWLTKALKWFEKMQDPRLLEFKDPVDGWTKVTIYGIEADSADRQKVEARFLAEVARMAGLSGVSGKKKSAKKL